MAMRWVVAWQTRLALGHAGVPLTTRRVFNIHLITSFFSVVLPGELAGAAVSWHLFSRDSGRRAQTAAALIYLRLIGFFMLVIIGAVGLFVEPRLLALHAHWAVLVVGVAVGFPLLSFYSPAVARILKRITDAVTGRLPWISLRSAFVSFLVERTRNSPPSPEPPGGGNLGRCRNVCLFDQCSRRPGLQ